MTKLILADTSVWVDFYHLKKDKRTSLLEEMLFTGELLVLCPPVLQEVLQGFREHKHYTEAKNLLVNLDLLKLNPYQAAIGAADIYRQLQKKGVTVRKSQDCLIAYYAIHFEAELLHNDRDFDKIALHFPLKTVKF